MEPLSSAVNSALFTTVMVAGPLLLLIMLIGLVVSVAQALTQINEMTLTFVPKFIGTILGLAVLGPWLLRQLETFTVHILSGLADMLS